ncbi:MAG: hypothetical protein ACRC6E_10190 [Fusobacteriaceae bacterium]
MKFGFRTPSLKKSLSARTTGALKRKVKKAIIPGYGKKGTGIFKDPKKAIYNKIYRKTTFGGLSGGTGCLLPMLMMLGVLIYMIF